MSKRAERRAHRARMVRRALTMLKASGYKEEINLRMRALRHADNMKVCSCWQCGNPRKWSKGNDSLTIQERKMSGRNPDELPDPELPEPFPDEPAEDIVEVQDESEELPLPVPDFVD